MNEQAIIEKMIAFIEAKERELQANKMSAETKEKKDMIKTIIDELEREIANEDNKN